MLLPSLLIQFTLIYGLLVYAQSPLQLGYIPLAVRTPYLHSWINSAGGKSPANVWPNFFSKNREFGWGGFIRVDNQTYQWMGNSGFNYTRTVTSEITPTKSIFRLEAGPIRFNVTFLSPIDPTDYVRQSIPFTYLYIDGFVGNDSTPHNVQVFTDISGQWVTRDDRAVVIWDTTEKDNMIYHRVIRQSPSSMLDNGGIAEDSTGYYAMARRPGITWQTGVDVEVRKMFANNGTMANSSDSSFRPVSQFWPIFGIAVDLGTISAGNQPEPVVWALGLVRDPLVTYTSESAVKSRSAYYWSAYANIDQVISAFLSDFSGARNRNLALDNKIISAASAVSPEYADILSLVTRQVFASMLITIPSGQPGQVDATDVKIFMKDIGNSLRTNPVEVIYGAFPALLYFNTSFAGHLLQPLFEFQSSTRYKNAFASPDLGTTFPVILGNSSDTRSLAVEHCGNMLIMAYAHAVKSGDGSLLSRYHSVLLRWADFLVENALHPTNSITGDGLNGSGMANLAFKGILGIYSMAKIEEALGVLGNTTYLDQATQMMKEWKTLALTDDHIQSIYGQANSWGLMYNLFPAIWLKTGLVDDGILSLQAQFYAQQSSLEFGPGLDTSSSDIAYPHWTLLTAATIPNTIAGVRDKLIGAVHKRAFLLTSEVPLPARYQTSKGDPAGGGGSAIHGAAFGILALGLDNLQIKAAPVKQTPATLTRKKSNVGAIVGGVIGSLAFLVVAAGILFFFWRRRRQHQQQRESHEYSRPRPFTSSDEKLPLPINTSNVVAQPQQYQGNSSSSGGTGSQWESPTRSEPTAQWRPENWEGIAQPQPQPRPSAGGSDASGTFPVGVAGAAPPAVFAATLSKHQEAMSQQSRGHTQATSVSGMTTLSNPWSATSGAEDLRQEVEELRREMNNIRAMAEPPPLYT